MEYIIIGVFIIWGIASIFYQFKLTAAALNKYNYFSLIPKWTFFAPIPKTTDYVLYYQDYDEKEDMLYPPVEIILHPDNSLKSAFKFIWNPEKRVLKSVTDLTKIIINYRKKYKKKVAQNSLILELYSPYLVMVNYVANHARPTSQNCKRRFMVYSSYGFFSTKKPVKTFESYFHEFD